jgi:hypothetical protein
MHALDQVDPNRPNPATHPPKRHTSELGWLSEATTFADAYLERLQDPGVSDPLAGLPGTGDAAAQATLYKLFRRVFPSMDVACLDPDNPLGCVDCGRPFQSNRSTPIRLPHHGPISAYRPSRIPPFGINQSINHSIDLQSIHPSINSIHPTIHPSIPSPHHTIHTVPTWTANSGRPSSGATAP